MFDVTQNVPIHCSNNQKMIVYQNSPKVTKYLGDFKRKICQREISKIAQSGRTDWDSDGDAFGATSPNPKGTFARSQAYKWVSTIVNYNSGIAMSPKLTL